MKRTHQFITVFVMLLTACCMLLFAGCKEGDASKTTASPSATGKATSAATESPAPTSAASENTPPPASATPKEKNLLAYAIDEDSSLLGGDSWVAIEDAWAGPLNEKRDGCENFVKQEFIETTLSDGSDGICYHYYSDSTTGFHVSGNTFGIMSQLEENKSYQLTLSLKFTVPNPTAARATIGVGCNLGSAPTIVSSSEEWQTITYTFNAGADVENAYLYVGPCTADMNGLKIGEIQAGFDLLIESVSLVEVP
jgi:lipoprotein